MKSMLRLRSLMSVAAIVLALISCSNDATEEASIKGESKTLEVNATIDQTRTTMTDYHDNLEWSTNDDIYLYIGETATEPNIIHPINNSTITATYNDGDNVYANYSLDNSSSTGVTQAEIKIAAEQTQSEANEFAGENLPMVAKGTIENDRVNLSFKPVGCVLVFNVYGPVKDERIKSIKFETSVGCCGGKLCDLTAKTLDYTADEGSESVTVTLDTPAAIGTGKPTNTKIGDNQVYLVVAPVNYPAGSKFTVTTTAGNTYTFKTTNGIDCSTKTACVVNLNLSKAPELKLKQAIEVPTVSRQSSDRGNLLIKGIVFKNIAAEEIGKADVRVYNDAELTQSPEYYWLTIDNTANLVNGQLSCKIEANDTAAERTAYIVIECAGKQAAITVTQEAYGASTNKYFVKVTEDLDDWTGKYLIVYEGENEAFAFDGSLTADSDNNYISVTITEQGIPSDDKTKASLIKASLIEISKIEGGYILRAASSSYIYSKSDSPQLLYSVNEDTAAQHPNSISIDGSGSESSVKIESHGSVMRFNTSSSRFKYFTSTSYTKYGPIQLYKLQE